MIKLFPLFTILLIFTSCGNKYSVEGTSSISRLDGKMLFIKTYKGDEWITIDSTEIIHGLFKMKGKLDTVMMTNIFLDKENIMPMVLESGNIIVTISNTQFTANGTPLNDALYTFIDKRNDLELQLEDLEHKEAQMIMDGMNIDEIHQQLTSKGEAIINESNAYIKKFISDNYENVLGPSVFLMLCNSLPYPVMTPQIEDILKDAPYSFKSNSMVREYIKKAKENMEVIEERRRLRSESN